MKKIVFIINLLAFASFSQGQILKKIADKAKNKVENASGNKGNNPDEGADPNKNKNAPDTTKKGEEPPVSKTESGPASFKTYSKYDFVPGEKVTGFEDFSTGSIGDFPAGWNTTSSAEIVTIEGKPGRWLWITKPGVFVPEFPNPFPEDFTFEFDLLHGIPISGANFTEMETDGKGEGEPIDKNDNPAGKANNRRVEFIKL